MSMRERITIVGRLEFYIDDHQAHVWNLKIVGYDYNIQVTEDHDDVPLPQAYMVGKVCSITIARKGDTFVATHMSVYNDSDLVVPSDD